MQLVRCDVWHVTFLEPGLQKPLPKTLTFREFCGPGGADTLNVAGTHDDLTGSSRVCTRLVGKPPV
jgi:hypothetical protein